MRRKHSGYKNNYMDNLSGKQWVKQAKIGGDGSEKGASKEQLKPK